MIPNYGARIHTVIKSNVRDSLFSLALFLTSTIRYIEVKTFDVVESTFNEYYWAHDCLLFICVSEFLGESAKTEELKVIMLEYFRTFFKPKEEVVVEDAGTVVKRDIFARPLEYEKAICDLYNFRYVLSENALFDDDYKLAFEDSNWQQVVGPLMWTFMHGLATKATAAFLTFLEFAHLFIACSYCSQHYALFGREVLRQTKPQDVELFLIRLHNYISAHRAPNILMPTELSQTPTPAEKRWIDHYKTLFAIGALNER